MNSNLPSLYRLIYLLVGYVTTLCDLMADDCRFDRTLSCQCSTSARALEGQSPMEVPNPYMICSLLRPPGHGLYLRVPVVVWEWGPQEWRPRVLIFTGNGHPGPHNGIIFQLGSRSPHFHARSGATYKYNNISPNTEPQYWAWPCIGTQLYPCTLGTAHCPVSSVDSMDRQYGYPLWPMTLTLHTEISN